MTNIIFRISKDNSLIKSVSEDPLLNKPFLRQRMADLLWQTIEEAGVETSSRSNWKILAEGDCGEKIMEMSCDSGEAVSTNLD